MRSASLRPALPWTSNDLVTDLVAERSGHGSALVIGFLEDMADSLPRRRQSCGSVSDQEVGAVELCPRRWSPRPCGKEAP